MRSPNTFFAAIYVAVARQRFDNAVSGRYQVERAREAIAREGGPVRAGAALGRRAAGKLRRLARRASPR
jgi:hypothetical protein